MLNRFIHFKLGLWVLLTMTAFAGNSFICRLALATTTIDPVSFTSIRLLSGALGLVIIVVCMQFFSKAMRVSTSTILHCDKYNLWGCLSLFLYALLFSLAYIKLDAGVGALLLFGFVQLTMLGWAVIRGDKVSNREWLGIIIALIGLFILLAPNEFSPDLQASTFMALSGVCWAIYTLNGKFRKTSSTNNSATAPPVALNATLNTAKNFTLALPLVLLSLFIVHTFTNTQTMIHLPFNGIVLASLSGIVTSAAGYSLWYTILPRLNVTTAACAQLSVPILAAIGGVVLINETISLRFLVATIITLTGITVTVFAKRKS